MECIIFIFKEVVYFLDIESFLLLWERLYYYEFHKFEIQGVLSVQPLAVELALKFFNLHFVFLRVVKAV